MISLSRPDQAEELAERLLTRFGSFGEALSAGSQERLAVFESEPEIEHAFLSLRLAMDHLLRAEMASRPILSSEPAVLDYLRFRMAFEPVETFRVLFLNAANELLADELISVGTISAVCVFPREVLKRCLALGATALLLVHNHPSGNPVPSIADRELTRRIADAAQSLGVVVHDHLVVARNGYTSFRRAGYL